MKKFFLTTLFVLLATQALWAAEDLVLSWDKSPEATQYQVFYRQPGSASTWLPLSSKIPATTFILPTMPNPNLDYELSVVASNDCGNTSDFSDPIIYNQCKNEVVEAVKNLKISVQVTIEAR